VIDLLDRDAFDAVLEFVHPNYAFPASRTCKTLHALLEHQPQQPFATDVIAMNYTPTMLRWAASLPVLCPPLKCMADLDNKDHHKRIKALESIGNLNPAVVAVYAHTIIMQFRDTNLDTFPDQAVRCTAVNTLCKLEPTALAPHANSIAEMLDNTDPGVRLAAMYMMGKLDPSTIAQHSDAIAQKLSDSCGDVRYTAMETLDMMAPEALTPHASAIEDLRQHSDPEVHRVTMHAISKLIT